MNILRRHAKYAVFMIVVVLSFVGCVPPDDNDNDGVPATSEPAPSPTTAALAKTISQDQPELWNCGKIKNDVFVLIELLLGLVSKLSEAIDAQGSVVAGDAEVSIDALLESTSNELSRFGSGFTAADQQALNLSCGLQGQHDAAVELWGGGNREEACAVWNRTQLEASTGENMVAIQALHPIVSRIWVSTTGEIAEGAGRCKAQSSTE